MNRLIKRRQSNSENDPLLRFRLSGNESSESSVSVRRQEEQAAELVGGRRHSGSGSQVFRKSDASSRDYQVECKQTEKESISLKLSWLEKISREAEGMGKEPLLHIRFLEAEDYVGKDWVMIRSREFEELKKG